MSDNYTPRHLRGLPEGYEPDEQGRRELMDLRTELDRRRRQRESGRDPVAPEPWGFPVPRPMALLFDRLPSPFTVQQAVDEGAALGLGEGDVAEAVEAMRRHELVSDGPEGFVKHPEAKNWF